MLSGATLPILAATVAAAAVAPPTYPAAQNPVILPLSYKYGGYPRVVTDIYWGSPQQTPSVETIVDLGSANFWVYGPNATINFGSPYLGVQGPCNVTAKPFYNYPKSKSATKPQAKEYGYSYGGNGKLVSVYLSVNDSTAFGNAGYPAFTNQKVAVANYTLLKQRADSKCTLGDYDHSILGVSPFVAASSKSNEQKTQGPSWRQDFLDRGVIESSTMSMWFDAPPADLKGDFQGTLLLGAVPKSKYSGELVHVALKPPADSYVGYYAATPQFRSAPLNKPSAKQLLKLSDKVPQCLIDSGSGLDTLPIDQDAFLKLTGLVEHGGYPAYNGSCNSIPKNATLDFTFAGLNNKSVTIKLPLRNYARGITDYLGDKTKCGLSMELDAIGSCVFGAPFFTGAFLAFNDEKGQMAMAQGGVSSGAPKGVNALGAITTVKKGQGLP